MSLKKNIIVKDPTNCPFRDDGYKWCCLHRVGCPNDHKLPNNCPLHTYSFIQVEKENTNYKKV